MKILKDTASVILVFWKSVRLRVGLLWCISVGGSYSGDSEVLGEALVGGVVE